MLVLGTPATVTVSLLRGEIAAGAGQQLGQSEEEAGDRREEDQGYDRPACWSQVQRAGCSLGLQVLVARAEQAKSVFAWSIAQKVSRRNEFLDLR